MKTNKVWLLIPVVSFACLGAKGSVLAVQPTYVKGTSVEKFATHSMSCGSICNNVGTFACQVSGLYPSGSQTTVLTYRESSCTNFIRDDRQIVKNCIPEEHILTVEH